MAHERIACESSACPALRIAIVPAKLSFQKEIQIWERILSTELHMRAPGDAHTK